MSGRQFIGSKELFLTVSSSLPNSLAQVRNSSYLWKGMTGSGNSLRYSFRREATVCTSVLLQRGGDEGVVQGRIYRGKHKSS